MEKLFAGLFIIIIALSFLCGGLLLHINDLQNQNSVFEDQTSEYQNQIGQLENQTSELEDQIYDLEEQIYQKKLSDARQVKITKVEVGDQIAASILGYIFEVHVTVQNYGTNDVDGLTVSVENTVWVGLVQAGITKTVTVTSGSGVWAQIKIEWLLFISAT